MNKSNRLALGAVQFGMSYGVANSSGQVNKDEVSKILGHAWKVGINTVDTAIVYGQSEKRLGEVGVGQWQVISKLPPIPVNCIDIITWVQESINGSLKRLKIPKLHGLLLHRSQELLESQGKLIYRAMVELKEQGKVDKIGISIYGSNELDTLCQQFHFDLVQAPFNIIDQRFATSGWMQRLHTNGTEVHVRSIFLQGLLLMDKINRPKKFNRWQLLWDQWHRWLDEQSLTPLQACLGFVMSHREIDRVLIGVDSLLQLQNILSSINESSVIPPSTLLSDDLDLINPSSWGAL